MLMRIALRVGLALLIALAFSTTAAAQSSPAAPAEAQPQVEVQPQSGSQQGDVVMTSLPRFSLNASVGPSFASVGTSLSTLAGFDVNFNDYVGVRGEFGFLPHTPFEDAVEVAPPVPGGNLPADGSLSAYHWNGNVNVRPYRTPRVSSYVTAGFGSFIADALVDEQTIEGISFDNHRIRSDWATNIGAGAAYRLNEWLGVGADYRTFFVHRDDETPRVHRFTAGLTFNVR
jgi:opacity protein-like surface antigen